LLIYATFVTNSAGVSAIARINKYCCYSSKQLTCAIDCNKLIRCFNGLISMSQKCFRSLVVTPTINPRSLDPRFILLSPSSPPHSSFPHLLQTSHICQSHTTPHHTTPHRTASHHVYLSIPHTGEVKSYPQITAHTLGPGYSSVVHTATAISCLGGCVGFLIFLGM
jgi:hypothetical protein